MNVLLFTHKSDIDGMGNAVLAKLAFEKTNIVLCETFNLQEEIQKFFNNDNIYNYDLVFVTDLCPDQNFLTKIFDDPKLKDKFFVFDHHKTALKFAKNFKFATVRVNDNHGLCCGTSLFYHFLTKKGFVNKTNNAIKTFCELTRRYDTWEWKNKYNDETARQLCLLFDTVGCDGYIKLMYDKLKNNQTSEFAFNDYENLLIDCRIQKINEKVANYANKINYYLIKNKKAGVVFIDYAYRNELTEYVKQKGLDIDFIVLIALDNETISYRSINPETKVRAVAELMGGKGHDTASSSPISKTQKQIVIDKLLNSILI